MTWKLGTCAACAAMWISATAGYSAISANFTDGNGTTTADQFQGKSGNGWAGGWTFANGSTVTASGTVINTTPLANGGNYLEATVTANSSATAGSGAMLGRVMDTAANSGINTAQAFTIDFDFRAPNMPGSGQSFTMFGNPSVGMAGSTNTWTVRAQSDGKWIAVYRQDTTTMTTVISGITFAKNTTYHITVRVDSANTSFGATITDGTNTGSIDGKNFRTTAADGGAAIIFGAFVPNGSGAYTFDVDNLTVAQVPEAASASLLLGGVGLLAGSSKFRKR